MKLRGISVEGMKRLASKVKGQDGYLQQVAPGLAEDEALNKIVDYLSQQGEMSGMDIVNDLGVDEIDVDTALQQGLIQSCPAPAGGGGSWYCVASRRPRRAQGIDLMAELESLGVPIETHESDVYVPVTPETTALIEQYEFKGNVEKFVSELDGKPWYDIPFAAMKSASKRAQEKGTGGAEYWKTVKAIAEDIKERKLQEPDAEVSEMVFEQVDGSEYIIYYAKNLEVLQNSPNDDAIDNVGGEIDTSKGWQAILTQVAFYAMEQDVWDALHELGYDSGNDDFNRPDWG